MRCPSGKFLLRVSSQLHRELRDLAMRRGRSLNRLCEEMLDAAVRSAKGLESTPAAQGGELGLLVEECGRAFGEDLLGVVLFGSVVRGEACAGSDLDVLLVIDRACPIRRELYSTWDRLVAPFAERRFGREVSPHFAHPPPDPRDAGGLWLELAIDGKVIWERGGEVSAVLRALRAHIAQGRVVRRVRHGHPYWVRLQRPCGGEAHS